MTDRVWGAARVCVLVLSLVGLVCVAEAESLVGYKGARLRGSTSCVHPNLIKDLLDRIGDENDYTNVVRIYIGQSYCIQADIPTILKRPLSDHTVATWDGYRAEFWETTLLLERGDGTVEYVPSYSIVFPQQMEVTYSD